MVSVPAGLKTRSPGLKVRGWHTSTGQVFPQPLKPGADDFMDSFSDSICNIKVRGWHDFNRVVLSAAYEAGPDTKQQSGGPGRLLHISRFRDRPYTGRKGRAIPESPGLVSVLQAVVQA